MSSTNQCYVKEKYFYTFYSDFPFLLEFNVSCHLIIVLVTFATFGFTNVWLFVQLSLEH